MNINCIHTYHWRKSRGGGDPPPPPLFEDKITLKLAFIVKKLTFLTVKLLKTPKIARSLRSLVHKCILRLDLRGFASTCILFLTSHHHLCKETCRIKKRLCNSIWLGKVYSRATNNTSEGDMEISRRDYSRAKITND